MYRNAKRIIKVVKIYLKLDYYNKEVQS